MTYGTIYAYITTHFRHSNGWIGNSLVDRQLFKRPRLAQTRMEGAVARRKSGPAFGFARLELPPHNLAQKLPFLPCLDLLVLLD